MYERMTDRARKVMQLANQEAQRLNHEWLGVEHVLLGIAKEGCNLATNVLKNLDVDLRNLRIEVEKRLQAGAEMVTMGKLPQTPQAKRMIEYSMEEARSLNHNYIGTEHLLLGLIRDQKTIAFEVLACLGVTYSDVKNEAINILSHLGTEKVTTGTLQIHHCTWSASQAASGVTLPLKDIPILQLESVING